MITGVHILIKALPAVQSDFKLLKTALLSFKIMSEGASNIPEATSRKRAYSKRQLSFKKTQTTHHWKGNTSLTAVLSSRQALRNMLIHRPSRRKSNVHGGSKRRLARHERVGEPSLVSGDPIPNRNLSASCRQTRRQSRTEAHAHGGRGNGVKGWRRR